MTFKFFQISVHPTFTVKICFKEQSWWRLNDYLYKILKKLILTYILCFMKIQFMKRRVTKLAKKDSFYIIWHLCVNDNVLDVADTSVLIQIQSANTCTITKKNNRSKYKYHHSLTNGISVKIINLDCGFSEFIWIRS